MLLTSLSGGKSGRSHQSVYIFYGKKQGFTDSLNKPAILNIEGDKMDKYSLRAFHAFDYNGDGFTDILAVSSKRNYKTLETGWTDTDNKLLLYRGSDTGISSTYETLKDIDDYILLKDAGDVNNDGIIDMLSLEPGKNGKDAVWTQYLSNKNHLAEIVPFITYPLLPAVTSDRIYDGSVWDLNGDKYDDNMIMREDKSPLLSMKKPDSTVYTINFYHGSEKGLTNSIQNTWIIKTAPQVFLNITTCGDLNNDGFGDLIIKRFSPVAKVMSKIEAFIIWGGKTELRLDTSENFNTFFHSLKYVGQGATSIDPLGDINNDGYADLLFSGFTVAYGSKDGNYKTVELKF